MSNQWLRTAVTYLRPETHMYSQKWAAEEAKLLNLCMKKVVFDELTVRCAFFLV